MKYCIQGKFHTAFIFALWSEDEFKTGLVIGLYVNDYIRKLERERIQNWANQSYIFIGRNKTGRIQSCIQYFWDDGGNHSKNGGKRVHHAVYIDFLNVGAYCTYSRIGTYTVTKNSRQGIS